MAEYQIEIQAVLKGAEQVAAGAQQISSALKGMSADTSSAAKTTESRMAQFVTNTKGSLDKFVQNAKWASFFFGSTLVAGITKAIDVAAEFQKFEVATKHILGTTEATAAFSAEVENLAKSTVFGIDQMQTLGFRLLSNTENAQLTTKTLKSLTDAVAGTGGGYSELEAATRAWIQVNSKATLSSEELNRQFANANIPVIRKLSEAIVNDLDHPLRKYITTAGSAGGVSKQLAKDFQKASGETADWGWNFDKLNAKLTTAKDKFGENAWQTKEAAAKLREYGEVVDGQKATIAAYTAAQGSANTTLKNTKLTVEEVMAALQDVGDLDIPGSIAAEAISAALEQAYGGSNAVLLDTFKGQLEKLRENFILTIKTIMGADVEGGPLDILTEKLKEVNKWVEENQGTIEGWIGKIKENKAALAGLAAFMVGIFLPVILGLLLPLIKIGLLFFILGYLGYKAYEKLKPYPNLLKAIATGLFLIGVALATAKIGSTLTTVASAFGLMSGKVGTIGIITASLKALGTALLWVWIYAKYAFIPAIASAVAAIAGFIATNIVIIAIIVAIVAVIAVVAYLIVKHWDTIKQKAGELKDWIIQKFTEIKDGLISRFQAIGATLEAFRNLIVAKVQATIQSIIMWFDALPGRVLQAITNLVLGVFYWFGYMYGFLTESLPAIFEQLRIAFVTWVTNMLIQLGLWAIQTMQKFWNFFVWVTTEFPNMLNRLWTSFITWTMNMAAKATEFFTVTIPETVKAFIAWITQAFTDFVEMARTKFTEFYEVVKEWITNTASWAWEEIKTWPGKIEGFLQSLPGKVRAILQQLYQAFRDKLSDIADAVSGWKDKVLGWFGDVIDKVRSAIDAIKNAFSLGREHGASVNLSFQHGGTIPGPIGSPVPILAHAGERVVPRSGVDVNGGGGGGVSINFYGNMSLDSDARVQELADKISRILGRQNELAQYGAGY